MVPKPHQKTLPFYEEIASASGGRAHLIRQVEPVRKYWSVVTAFRDICDDAIGSVTVFSDIHDISDQFAQSSGDFLVDSSLGRDTIFGIIVEDEEDHLIDTVVFENENGEVYGPYSHIATTFDAINMKTISFGLTRHQPFGDRGHVGQVWRYTVTWHRPDTRREAVVMVTSRPRTRDTRVGRVLTEVSEEVMVRMWTSEDAASLPLTMYVSVHKGGRPVVGALVKVSVEVTPPDLTEPQHLGPLQLHDRGDGDPDLVSADGVYTRHLDQYPGPGRYVFTAHVSSMSNVTRVLSPANTSSEHVSWLATCCGSSALTPGLSLLTPSAPFTRMISGPAVSLTPGLGLAPPPPGRVTDLSITLLTPQTLTASWSSPPGPPVTSNTFLISDNISLLLGPVSAALTSAEVTRVTLDSGAGAGDQLSHELSLEPGYGDNFYIGLISEAGAHNPGRVSNLVIVMIPAPAISESEERRELETVQEAGESASMIILGVCVSLLLLALCLIIAVLYYIKFRRHKSPGVSRHPAAAATVRDDITDNTSCSSDARNNSSNNLMPELGVRAHTISSPYLFTAPPPSVTDSAHLFTAPPSSLPDSTPTYWSATKLLTEHEQRALAMSYAPLTGGALSAVKEEYIGYPEEYPPSFIDDDSLTYSVNHDRPPGGVTNPSFRHSGAEMAGIYDPECSDSLGSQEAGEAGDLETPVRFSTAVQTIAPSTIARLRQNNTYLASLKTRNVSLV